MFCPLCKHVIAINFDELELDEASHPVCSQCGWGKQNDNNEELPLLASKSSHLFGFSPNKLSTQDLEHGIDNLSKNLGGGALLSIAIYYSLVGLFGIVFFIFAKIYDTSLTSWVLLPIAVPVILSFVPRGAGAFLVCSWPTVIAIFIAPYCFLFYNYPQTYWVIVTIYLGCVAVVKNPVTTFSSKARGDSWDLVNLATGNSTDITDIASSEIWYNTYAALIYPGKLACLTIAYTGLTIWHLFFGKKNNIAED